MILHILRFAFKDGVTDDEKAEVLAAMDRIASAGRVAFKTSGRDLGNPADGFTHGYCVGLEDFDALEHYMNTGQHFAGDLVIFPRLAKLGSFDISDDPDPELDQKIAAMHGRRAQSHPEVIELLRTIPELHLPSDV